MRLCYDKDTYPSAVAPSPNGAGVKKMKEKDRMKKAVFGRRLLACAAAVAVLASMNVSTLLAAPEQETDIALGDVSVARPAEGAENGGHIPSALDQSYYNYGSQTMYRRSRTSLPSSYDLRTKGVTTSVKDQSPWGSCWTFGAMSSMESNALMDMGASGSDVKTNPDYSERHLGYFAYQLDANGEGKRALDQTTLFDLGGNRDFTVGLLSSWSGAALESDVPYTNNAGTTSWAGDWSVDESKRYLSAAHLQNADYLPGTAVFDSNGTYSLDWNAVATIKSALMNRGVVDVSYNAEQNLPGQAAGENYWNETYDSQFINQFAYANHEVSIVGWDDNFSASKFNVRPEGDGAWIVKNSWGSNWGDGGYFYLSYYDRTICDFTCFDVELPGADGTYQYDHNYQYDLLGKKSTFSFMPDASNELSIANIFTAQGDEKLQAVSAVTVTPGSKVKIQIYKVTDNSSPVNGILVASQTNTISYGGYHTIALNQPVQLKAGEHFSVIETIVGSDGYYYPIEIGADTSDYGWTDVAKIERGQSFVGLESAGDWCDLVDDPIGLSQYGLTTGNAMIKAFTTDGVTNPNPPAPESEQKPTLYATIEGKKSLVFKDGIYAENAPTLKLMVTNLMNPLYSYDQADQEKCAAHNVDIEVVASDNMTVNNSGKSTYHYKYDKISLKQEEKITIPLSIDDKKKYIQSYSIQINVTADNGESYKVIHKIDVTTSDWIPEVHSNSFGHPDNYQIGSMYFNKLVEGETKGVRNAIQAKIDKKYAPPEVFPGSCMGMSSVMALAKIGRINIKDINKNVSNFHELNYQIDAQGNKAGTLKNLVNYYQLTQSIPSAQLKETSASLGFFSQSKVKDILKRIVTLASNETEGPFLLHINFDKKTIDTKTNKEKIINAGHALVVCGYEYKDKKHVLKLVDPNVMARGEDGFVYFTIPEDYDLSKCVLSNAAGYRLVKLTGVGYQELSSLDRFALTSKEIQGTSTKKTSEPIETILRASTAYPFTVVNASGQTLTYDGEDFSGDMEVKNFNIISNDGIEAPSMMDIEVSNSDTFTVTFPEEVEFEVIADKMYAGVQATGTDKIVFSAESGIEMTGKNIMQTTYLTMNNEYVDMISVSGDVGNSMTLKQNGADIAMNAQKMDEVVVSSFKDVEKQEQTVESATDSIVISGDETGIAVEEGTATIKGDLTGDGKADISDLMMLAQAVNGRTSLTAEQSTAADVTGDGKADIADLMKLAQFVNGKIDTLDE